MTFQDALSTLMRFGDQENYIVMVSTLHFISHTSYTRIKKVKQNRGA
jgi:hypothetical protein